MQELTITGMLKVFFSVSIVLLSAFQSVHASEKESIQTPIEIKSNVMTAEDKKNMITFDGSVVATKDNITIYSDRMVVYYSDDKEIKRIIAHGHVRLIQDSKEIVADKALYFADDQRIIFTGNPVFKEDNRTVSGSQITYYISSQQSKVKDSRVILR